ncbi:hypothetical protein HOLleu_20167 [Holothuria leucospilota]|uniref:Uncharacterized protein n=1 Tax=Holothuria leucospilota TaxID=206669 RepID=A0A9Q1C0N9_HOLLE|nr:hypothetical protein HOLleu_20167 [Holothuria leucospilota]
MNTVYGSVLMISDGIEILIGLTLLLSTTLTGPKLNQTTTRAEESITERCG